MFKKLCALGLSGVTLMGSLVGCTSNQEVKTSTGESAKVESTKGESNKEIVDDKSEEIVIEATQSVKETVNVKEYLLAERLKKDFNLVIDKTEIPINDYLTKMSLIFASGEEPDFMYSLRPDWKLNEWIDAEYLKGLTVDEIKEVMPNYINLFTEEEWKIVYDNIKYLDGKVYYFPGRRGTSVDMAWMYRKDTFEELGLEYPKTTDELYEVLTIIKEKTGKVPYVAASAQVLWAFSGFLQAFGMPELAIRQLSYVDPVTNEFVPYAFSEDNYREALIYLNKLYKEGLIWKEFATATTEQVKKFQTQGNGFVLWGYPSKTAEYENISRSTEAEAEWDWAKDMVSKDPNKVFFKRNVYFNADGFGFSSEISDEKFNRLTEYLNWAMGEEGQLFHTFGEEGITYEMKDNTPMYLDHLQNPNKAEGEKLGSYQISPAGFGKQHSAINEVYLPIYKELEEVFINRENYYFFTDPIMQYIEEENKAMVDIQTNINDVRDEYAAKFIMGQIDPANDKDWGKYIETLNKLGLEDFKQIRIDTYNRGIN